MNVSRKSVNQALFNLLINAPLPAPWVFGTTGRRLIHFSKLPQGNQPALFLVEGHEQVAQPKAYGMSVYKLSFDIVIYFRVDASPAPDVVPSDELDDLLDGIDSVLNPKGAPQTLGGLVTNCWIDGTVLRFEGLDGVATQGLVVIPVSVITGS